ncbi:MAG: ATP-dependent helicase [Niastella sp.]|nr:ATP-dependent helicase [Niastella sp.]
MHNTILHALLEGLNDEQKAAVQENSRQLLVVAGAGSGKTEVMARRVAWWVANGIAKNHIVAFTFTESAAEELKFRIRKWIERIHPSGSDPTLGGMYVGTIHGFCLRKLRELAPEEFYDHDMIDDVARLSLFQKKAYNLDVASLKIASNFGLYQTIEIFFDTYDQLNEHDQFEVQLTSAELPNDVATENDWIRGATILTNVGNNSSSQAFGRTAARYYAYLRARRFLDFSTIQSELARLFRRRPALISQVQQMHTHVVIDEVQDTNPVQLQIIRNLVGAQGNLTAVGDHRQAIYSFRGGRVDLMAELHQEFTAAADGNVIELNNNYRSTPRIINIANAWSQTIQQLGSLPNPTMAHGNASRTDYSDCHVSINSFLDTVAEANRIASIINALVNAGDNTGAYHDDKTETRGIGLKDVAILLRSSTDVRTYMNSLRNHNIPFIVKAGPDLFSQSEILLFFACLAMTANLDSFMGREIIGLLGLHLNITDFTPENVIRASANDLINRDVLKVGVQDRLLLLAKALSHKLYEDTTNPYAGQFALLKCKDAARYMRSNGKPRRIFPQELLHWFIEEAELFDIDDGTAAHESILFHVGQFSKLIKGIETPGWTTADEFKYQVIAISVSGISMAKADDASLLTLPNAVTISTIHGAKGLEFPVVFLADVKARRFPSNMAKRAPTLFLDGVILQAVNPGRLADNNNFDGERRLMYVALTRAERYLFISKSGANNRQFYDPLLAMVRNAGGRIEPTFEDFVQSVAHMATKTKKDDRLVTSFTDLHYYTECPHDYYLRKVLGFTPTIDQAFGYGRAVHNLLREINSNPAVWGALAADEVALLQKTTELVQSGKFYLRYTTGDPLENMRRTAQIGIAQYVRNYSNELNTLEFMPEKEFETLIAEENLLISGSIDLVRLDDPPRITIIDFKSGENSEKASSGLSTEMMRQQVGIYGLAAKHELEFEPDRGIIRYIGEREAGQEQKTIELNDLELATTRQTVINTAKKIKEREFHEGPSHHSPDRCVNCDFLRFCGRPEAHSTRTR